MSKKVIKNFQSVKEKIAKAASAAVRDPEIISLITISKRRSLEDMQALLDAYPEQIIFGENFVQEFEVKKPLLKGNFQSHLTGPLQSNKAKKAVALFDVIETVHSLKIAKAISKEAKKINKIQEVFLQVNISEDTAKNGFLAEELESTLPEILALDNLRVTGLMCITRLYDNPEEVRADFIKMRKLRDSIKLELKISMGMSADFEIAVREGADVVRVGSAIFL